MFVRQANDGNWYVCRRNKKKDNILYRNWWLVKYNVRGKGECGMIYIKQGGHNYSLSLPKQFIGKKVMLKVEVVEFPRK